MVRFILLCICAFLVSAGGGARAADPFTVAGVPVDAKGENAIEAQIQALSDGQVAAARILMNRLTLLSERSRKDVPPFTLETVAPLVRALEIANEKRSANRYLGSITVAFNPSRVQSFLRNHGLNVITTQSRTRLVIPVLSGQPLWSENPWSTEWNTRAYSHALTPIRSFQPDEANEANEANEDIINAPQAGSIDMDALRRAGQRFGVGQILVAEASAGLDLVTVRLTDIALDTGQVRDLGTVTAGDYRTGAAQSVTKLENDWKQAYVSLSQNAETLSVTVLYKTHADWLSLQDTIDGSFQIIDARLDAISKDGAMMTIRYGGDMNRLAGELGFKGVEIEHHPELGVIIYRRGRI
ncbi:MAG: hypothetical protein GDA35_07675 [Hyphomonadaceae bacterium]|nr:hypothetical protein [Hyphomonadaceae bacterium]